MNSSEEIDSKINQIINETMKLNLSDADKAQLAVQAKILGALHEIINLLKRPSK